MYTGVFRQGYINYWNYLIQEITTPTWNNYFYWLIGVSLFFFLVEYFKPWHKHGALDRRDFWIDTFYMFFNFFIFSLVIYNAASDVVVVFFQNSLMSVGIENLVLLEVLTWPTWLHLFVGFILRDFVQWNVHRLLHQNLFLWGFHKVHHSVKEMGFSAHLRYHWVENVVYRSIEYIPLAIIGIGLRDFFVIHIFTLAVGHFNHSNIKVPLGPLKYILNNPQMHIWHHAKELPIERRKGVNFGITLSIWDYLFRTDYIPYEGRDISLGYEKDEEMPSNFFSQLLVGFRRSDQGK